MADDDIVQNKLGAKQVIWDKNKSIRANINDNLDLIAAGEILPRGFAKDLRSDEEVQALKQLRAELDTQKDDVGFNAYSLSSDDSLVQKLLDDLPSHNMGSPSYLYAVLARAQQEYTEQEQSKKEQVSLSYIGTKEKIEKEKKNLEGKIESHNKEFSETILSLRGKSDNKESQLRELRKEEMQVSSEIWKKEREIISEKKEMKLLRGESDRLDSALILVGDYIASWDKHKQHYQSMQTQRSSSDPSHLSHQSRSFRDKFFKVLDGLLKGTNEQVVALSSRYYDTVRPSYLEEEKRSEKLEQTATEMQRLIDSIKELQESKSVKNEGIQAAALNQTEVKVESAIQERPEAARLAVSEEVIRKVSTAGGPKEFEWHDHLNVCANIERLLKNYIDTPGHSAGRVKSAKAVLKRAQELKDSGAEDVDRQLLTYIRDQNISSRGFNKEKSLLHAIYRESERAYRSSLVQERLQMYRGKGRLEKKWAETKEKLTQEMKASNPELEAESQRSEKLSERHDDLQAKIDQARARLKELETEKDKVSQIKKTLQKLVEAKSTQLEEQSKNLLQLRKDTITLGMKAHSSHQYADKKEEESFVKTNVALIETVDAMDKKQEELHHKSNSEEKKTQGMKESNEGQEIGIRDSFLRIARDNQQDLGYAPERIAAASVDSLLSRVTRFEEKLRTGEVQSTPASEATKSMPHAPQKESDHHEVDHPEERSGPKNN